MPNLITGDIEKARAIASTARSRASLVHGDEPPQHRKREFYDSIADDLEAAIRLCDGPIPERSAHWRERLPGLVDEKIELMREVPLR